MEGREGGLDAAATRFLARREKKFADVSDAQAAFATFEAGDLTRARARLETLGRRLYSSDVRAALVACYWRMGEGALAEDAWLKLCEMKNSRCGKYGDRDWLVSYRRWTPGLADAMEDFLALRVRPGWGCVGGRVRRAKRDADARRVVGAVAQSRTTSSNLAKVAAWTRSFANVREPAGAGGPSRARSHGRARHPERLGEFRSRSTSTFALLRGVAFFRGWLSKIIAR